MHPFIKELLGDEKITWKKLGEVCNLRRGRVISKKYIEENKGDYPVYSSQTLNNGEIGRINTYDLDGEYATWTTDGAYAGTVFYRQGKFSITNICGLVTPKENNLLIAFVAYYLQIVTKDYVNQAAGNPKLMSNVIAEIPIPIPPLKVQQKIVEILDKFCELNSELKKERLLREKQYGFYRDKLLSFGEDIPRLSLKYLTEIGTGSSNRQDETEKGDYPFYVRSKNILKSNTFEYDEEAIIIPGEGGIGEIFHYANGKYALHQRAYRIHLTTDKVKTKFLYYVMTNFFKEYIVKKSVVGTVASIRKGMIEDFIIPIPPLKTQLRIIDILDKFEMISSSLISGLPREIELREKQYRYYRDLLLNFSEYD